MIDLIIAYKFIIFNKNYRNYHITVTNAGYNQNKENNKGGFDMNNNPFENERNEFANDTANINEQTPPEAENREPQRPSFERNEGGYSKEQYNYGYQQNSSSYGYGYTGPSRESQNYGQNVGYGSPYYGGNGGYGNRPEGQNMPYGQYYSPYYGNNGQRQSTPYYGVKKEKKSASKGFVIGVCAIALALSFLINTILIAAMYPSSVDYDSNGGILNGNDVIVEYAPENGEKPVITDKGNAAYVSSLVLNSVVEVSTETVVTDSYFGNYVTQGAGSGVIISSTDEGSYILTCAHVIDGAAKVTVKLTDGTEFTADSFLCDSESDIGVIKINAKGLPCATIGDFSKVVVGEEVVAIGNPLGTLGGSVTNGIVSALERDVIIDGTTYNLLQTNAEINPGNSGGGLFNLEGHLIGIVNAKSVGENIEGLGFAIPIDNAMLIMKDLLEKGYVSGRVKLGFELFEIQTQEDIQYWFKYSRYFTDYGVYIVSSESPDFQEGDLLIAIGDDMISCITDLKAILQKYKVGQTVSVTVSRLVGKKVQMFTYDLTLTEKKS